MPSIEYAKDTASPLEWCNSYFKTKFSSCEPSLDDALEVMQREAFLHFRRLGVPKMRAENWRHTDISEAVKIPAALTSLPKKRQLSKHKSDAAISLLAPSLSDNSLVFVDGFFCESLSSTKALPKTVTCFSLRSTRDRHVLAIPCDIIEKHLSRYASSEKNAFVALNTALMDDVCAIHIASGTKIVEPLEIIFVSTEWSDKRAIFPRILIVAEADSHASIIERFAGKNECAYLTNAVTEIVLNENASLEYHKVQNESLLSSHISATYVHQSRSSDFSAHLFSLGSKLARNEIHITLAGKNSSANIFGLSMAGSRQHLDTSTTVDHAVSHCKSYQLLKGIYGDDSCGVFNGTIVVREKAQKTTAFQKNSSLLLSPNASTNSQPQLKIWADDVKCSHGATVGTLDDEALYYLRSRGIDEKLAKSLLVSAFANEVVELVKNDRLRHFVSSLLSS